MRIGVMGGTFDPIHIGHLIAASEVHTALQLDTVWFIPAGQPWQKATRKISSPQHRFEMTKLAVAQDSRFVASDIEVLRDGPTYSIDTVQEIKRIHPDAEIFWIVGADVASRMTTWHRWDEFIASVQLVVVNRPDSAEDLLPFDHVAVSMPSVRISATQLRQRYSAGIANTYLVPGAVDDYITSQKLFSSADTR
jgi:nicotinate-nucleotide adenylyltransferase